MEVALAEPCSLAVQSVLYGNSGGDVIRAARAIAHSVRLAAAEGLVSSWVYRLGDCSPVAAIGDEERDTIRNIVAESGGTVDYVYFAANLGSARGHNTLAGRGQEDLMLILNPDAIVAADTVSVLAGAMQEGIGVAEARQVPIEHPKHYDAVTGDTSWASTACAMTRRTVFDLAGGFDPDTFFLYCDDVDYSWRVKLAGFRVVFTPAATVFHDKRLSVEGAWLASSAEKYYSAEAALLLPMKYSRPDIVKKVRRSLERSSDREARRALDAVDQRIAEGLVPTPLDANHKVAQFVGPNYAEHRF